MSDGIGKDRLLSILRMGDEQVWSIVHRLAITPEPLRRRTLRPHADAGFTRESDQADIGLRAELDTALWPLTLFEIGREIGVLAPADPLPVVRSDLENLFKSEALLRYSNAYLYFGIRFLAGRVAPPEWFGDATPPQPPERSSNRQEFALVPPPPVGNAAEAQQALANFLQFQSSDETREAMRFLDDFISDDEEPDWLERWLRGLRPETDQPTTERFERIAQGLPIGRSPEGTSI